MPEYKTAKPKKPIEVEDMEVYLEGSKEGWMRALIVFLWVYGVRIEEALSLKGDDFFEAEGFLWVNCPPNKNLQQPRRVLPVSLDTTFLSHLVEYVRSKKGSLIWPQSYVTVWRRLKDLDVELCPHRFRHNRATQYALKRAHPYELQAWLGHSDIRTASKYIHASGIFAEDLGKRIKI